MSRVARDNPTVNAQIRNRVKQAASRLGVTLEERRNESRMLVFLLANRDVLHGFHARALVGAQNFCSRMNWELALVSFQYSPGIAASELVLPQILSSRSMARAAILAGMNYPNLLDALRARRIPCAVMGNNMVGEWGAGNCDAIYSNDIQGAIELTRHLISRGHRHIWFVGNSQLPWLARCRQGYDTAMRAADLEPRTAEIHSDGPELGYLATKCILARRDPATAIFAGSDHIARGVYAALRESAVSVPQGMSVVGCNDIEGALLQPALTSLREFPEELGRHLADFVLKRIENADRPPQQLTIPTQMVLRDSVASI